MIKQKYQKIKKINHQKSEKGQSLIELAISLVILLILLAGIVDLGRVSFYYIAMRDAAQEGATYGTVYPNHCFAIEDRVRAGVVDDSTVNVSISVNGENCLSAVSTDACEGKVIAVTVSDPDFPITMPLLGSFLGSQTISLETTIEDTILRPGCD
jgi:hypothetical protein